MVVGINTINVSFHSKTPKIHSRNLTLGVHNTWNYTSIFLNAIPAWCHMDSTTLVGINKTVGKE